MNHQPHGCLVALIPAYNEAGSIAATIEAALNQTRPADQIVVIPNGCTDNTATIARQYPVTVLELPRLPHKKSEALNTAWLRYAEHADTVICLDADTVLPPHAFHDWEQELLANPNLGGASSKFTMQQPGLLPRLQKAEFATWTMTGLRLGHTTVLAGTGCAIRGQALRDVAAVEPHHLPWAYDSAVEDFKLTFQIRMLGYHCHISPTVRAYTDSMPTLGALWAQRMKWSVGTQIDLLDFGFNRLTWRDWAQQAMGLLNIGLKLLWLAVITGYALTGNLQIIWIWLLLPVLFIALDIKRALLIPHRDWKDLALAAAFFPNEAFMWLRAAWTTASWLTVIKTKITRNHTDLWDSQARAEGIA